MVKSVRINIVQAEKSSSLTNSLGQLTSNLLNYGGRTTQQLRYSFSRFGQIMITGISEPHLTRQDVRQVYGFNYSPVLYGVRETLNPLVMQPNRFRDSFRQIPPEGQATAGNCMVQAEYFSFHIGNIVH